ncbi:inositol-tetrakisphosphate 1-kinase, partial [Fennellomyces sp. T-0311]
RVQVICKRQTACSVGGSHEMALVPSQQWMASLDQCFQPDEPVLFQEFIEHDGVVIKVYVADDTICISSRPSFQNKADTLVSFDSQKLPKAFGEQQEHVVSDSDVQQQKERLVDHRRLRGIADRLRRELGLTFFGFDVLLASGSAAYYVVDVNYFPSFAELPNFQEVFVNVIQRYLAQ